MLRLKKGCGYHLDLLVLALVVVISSVFGLPWFIANTIPSINHMQSLTKVKAYNRGVLRTQNPLLVGRGGGKGRAIKEKITFLAIKLEGRVTLNGLAISGGTFFSASLGVGLCFSLAKYDLPGRKAPFCTDNLLHYVNNANSFISIFLFLNLAVYLNS